jgi:hypothetical protein
MGHPTRYTPLIWPIQLGNSMSDYARLTDAL